MKKLIPTIILSLSMFSMKSQSMPPLGAKWTYLGELYYRGETGIIQKKDTNVSVVAVKDTLYEGLMYRKFETSAYVCLHGLEREYYLYEDKGRVFYKKKLSDSLILAYDFNKKKGDTWIAESNWAYYKKVQVDSISQIEVNNYTLKRLHLTYYHYERLPTRQDDYMMVETYCSVVNERTLDESYFLNYKDYAVADCEDIIVVIKSLKEYKDQYFTIRSSLLFKNCVKQPLGIGELNQVDAYITFYPTVANDFLQLESSVDLSEAEYYLISSNGQRQKVNIDTYNKLNTSTLKAGIYFLQMQIDDSVKTLKFVKE